MVGNGSWVVCVYSFIVPDSYKLNITYITGNIGHAKKPIFPNTRMGGGICETVKEEGGRGGIHV